MTTIVARLMSKNEILSQKYEKQRCHIFCSSTTVEKVKINQIIVIAINVCHYAATILK